MLRIIRKKDLSRFKRMLVPKDNKKKGYDKKKGSKSIQKNVKDNKKKGSKKKMTGSDTFFKNDSPNAWFPK